jgi:hypothetical protein
MNTLLRTFSAMVGAFALCGCATIASPPSKSLVATDHCADRLTGSDITANASCMPPGVRSYSQADLQSTGRSTVSDALPMLDPALTVKR